MGRRRQRLGSSDKSETHGRYPSGYCYLALFDAYNASFGTSQISLTGMRKHFGAYPLLRRVLGYLMSFADGDFYVPRLILVKPGLYHVDRGGLILFAEAVSAYLFSAARVGAVAEDEVDRANRGIRTFARLCEIANLDLDDAMAESSRRLLGDMMREPTSEIRNMVRPMVASKYDKSPPLRINYTMEAKDISALQKEFPELNVIVAGGMNHPHALAAASRICAEEYILRALEYSPQRKSILGNKDVYLIDIGANYLRHVKRQRYNIHCCVPIVDLRDSAREMARKSNLTTMVTQGRLSKGVFEDYVGTYPRRLRRCRKLSSQCDVTANCGMLIHSQYDITSAELARTFDAHKFDIVWSVVIFDVRILYMTSGLIPELKVRFRKENGKIYFSFVGDSSLNYVHDYDDYMRLIHDSVLVTPAGRTYLIEKVTHRCGNLFIKYIYCEYPPMTKELHLVHSFWAKESNTVLVTTWEYVDEYFSDSKIVAGSAIVSFRRRLIEVDKRFADLLYGHCLRSGDKSFNLFEVSSAGLSFASRMSINGNDVRAVNRVPMEDFMAVVVAIYCIAYRQRYGAGKTLERFTLNEKQRRESNRLGLVDVMRCCWDVVRPAGALDTAASLWNSFVGKCAEVRARGSLDVAFFDSVRFVEFDEFFRVSGAHTDDAKLIDDVHVESLDVQVENRMLTGVVDYVRRKVGVEVEARVPESGGNVEPPAQLGDVVVPRTKVKKVLTYFHRDFSSRSETSRVCLNRARSGAVASCPVVIPGNVVYGTLFSAIAEAEGVSEGVIRAVYYKWTTEQERAVMPNNGVILTGFGMSDFLRVYSRVKCVSVCLHLRGEADVITREYGGEYPATTLHFVWRCDKPGVAFLRDTRVNCVEDVSTATTGDVSSISVDDCVSLCSDISEVPLSPGKGAVARFECSEDERPTFPVESVLRSDSSSGVGSVSESGCESSVGFEAVTRIEVVPAESSGTGADCDCSVVTDGTDVGWEDAVSHIAEEAVSEGSDRFGALGSVGDPDQCCEKLELINVPGDGHCMFRALAMGVDVDHLELRDLLWDAATERERLLLGCLRIRDGTNAGWGTTDCLPVFSRVFGVGVCVHSDVEGLEIVTRMYTPGSFDRYIHVRWVVRGTYGHVDYYRPPPRAPLDIMTDGVEIGVSVWAAYYDYIHRNGLRKFSASRDLLSLGLYINRSAYKLSEIMARFRLVVPATVLDLCGAPGGFVQVLLDLGATRVDTVSLGPYSREVLRDTRVNVFKRDIFAYHQRSGSYGLVVADGASEDSYRDDSIFNREIEVALGELSVGGCLIIKNNNYFTLDTSRLNGEFERVIVYKPRLSREGNSEVYLVCLGYASGRVETEFLDDERSKFVAGINKYLAGDDTCYTSAQMLSMIVAPTVGCTIRAMNRLVGGGDLCKLHLPGGYCPTCAAIGGRFDYEKFFPKMRDYCLHVLRMLNMYNTCEMLKLVTVFWMSASTAVFACVLLDKMVARVRATAFKFLADQLDELWEKIPDLRGVSHYAALRERMMSEIDKANRYGLKFSECGVESVEPVKKSLFRRACEYVIPAVQAVAPPPLGDSILHRYGETAKVSVYGYVATGKLNVCGKTDGLSDCRYTHNVGVGLDIKVGKPTRTVSLGTDHSVVDVVAMGLIYDSGASVVDVAVQCDLYDASGVSDCADVCVKTSSEGIVELKAANDVSENECVSVRQRVEDSMSRAGCLAPAEIKRVLPIECGDEILLDTQLDDGIYVLPVMVVLWDNSRSDEELTRAVERFLPDAHLECVVGAWTGYYSCVTGRHLIVVFVDYACACESVSSFFRWCSVNFSRMYLLVRCELTADFIRGIVTKYCVRVRYLYLGSDPFFVEKVDKVGHDKPLAFPKLTTDDLGFCRVPEFLIGDSSDVSYRNSMLEYRHVTAMADDFNLQEYTWITEIIDDGQPSEDTLIAVKRSNYNIYDNINRVWLLDVGENKYMYGVIRGGYVKYLPGLKRFDTSARYVVVSKRTEVMLNAEILENILDIDVSAVVMPEVVWVNGPPGCGKTTYILQRFLTSEVSPTDLILSMTKEGVTDIRRRLKSKYSAATIARDVRTVASLLVNGTSVKYERVYLDEALMMHAGVIGYVAFLTEARQVIIIGDKNQIPYIDRDHICPLVYYHPERFCRVSSELRCSYRCPVDVVYSLMEYYPDIFSASSVVRSMRCSPFSEEVMNISKTQEDTLYLAHFRSDKEYMIREGYGRARGSKVLTTHEAQGLTFKHVILVRTNPKPLMLYDRVEYSIVAVSRHTVSFVYYTDVADATVKLMCGSADVDDVYLREWNSSRKRVPMRAGGYYFSPECLMLPNNYTGAFEDALVGLPHATHPTLRPRLVAPAVTCELLSRPRVPTSFEEDMAYIQAWYDDKMPGCCVDVTNDQLMMEMADTDVFLGSIDVDPTKCVYRRSKFGKLRPFLRTIMPANRTPSQKESILGAVKRNLNAPRLANEGLSAEVLADKLYKNFLLSAVDPGKMDVFLSYRDSPIDLSPQLMEEWLQKQPPGVRRSACDSTPLHLRPFNLYNYMIKGNLKPPLEPTAVNKYSSVQTIAYYDKSMNAVFCPVFNIIKERLLCVLRRSILLFTDMSNEDFEREINCRLDGRLASIVANLENDMSKYDKAQARVLRVFEDRVLLALGMPESLLEIWHNSHAKSRMRDRKGGIAFETEYQRKSGDASTFLGNTLVLLAVLLSCYRIDDIELMLLAGDDSVIFFRQGYFVRYDPSARMADLFNLECKLLDRYSSPYFCSKFLVITDTWIYFVPDPLKVVTKLGRKDMSNYEHVEEYRISCVDIMKPMFNPLIAERLSWGVAERYKGQISDCTKLLNILATLCRDRIKFSKLFIHDRGVQLCMDPTRSKLG